MEKDLVLGNLSEFVAYKVSIIEGKLTVKVEGDLVLAKEKIKAAIPGGVDDVVLDAVFKILLGV